MNVTVLVTVLAILAIRVASPARILGFFPVPSISHQFVFRQIMLGLNKAGHEITIVTPNPIGGSLPPNYTEIDVNFVYKPIVEEFDMYERTLPELFMWKTYHIILRIIDMELSHEPVRRLIRDGDFDLVMVEFLMFPSITALSHRFRAPFIGVASLDLAGPSHAIIGNPYHPTYYPDWLIPLTDKSSFLCRVRSTIAYTFWSVSYEWYWKGKHNELARKHFGPDIPDVGEIEKNVSLVLVNTDFTTGASFPAVPGYVRLGGGRPIHMPAEDRSGRRLPTDIQQFLDNAPEGVVYFSLGSNVKSNAMPEEKRRVFIEAFKRIKQKVLWKWEEDVLPGKPDNVKIGKWLPQTDILAHPNIKLFITQGGLQSLSEATYNKVPMMVIPFFADQELNAKKLTSEEVAIRIDYEQLELESFLAALNELLNNPKYKENIERYSDLTQDQPQSPMERAIWWTEYVIRHKGARHLRSAAVDMPWYQYLLLDVIAFIVAVLVAFVYLMYATVRFIVRLLCRGNKTKKD